ncbi:predicted protein [Streptomyces sp. AA4]|nr:predicted protein [Streptomyces sp. AA4]
MPRRLTENRGPHPGQFSRTTASGECATAASFPPATAVAVRETSEDGRYEFPALPSGRYEVVTTGFPPSTTRSIPLAPQVGFFRQAASALCATGPAPGRADRWLMVHRSHHLGPTLRFTPACR